MLQARINQCINGNLSSLLFSLLFVELARKKIDIPPAPDPACYRGKGTDFNQAQGELNEDALLALKDWLTSSGGLGTISLIFGFRVFAHRLAW